LSARKGRGFPKSKGYDCVEIINASVYSFPKQVAIYKDPDLKWLSILDDAYFVAISRRQRWASYVQNYSSPPASFPKTRRSGRLNFGWVYRSQTGEDSATGKLYVMKKGSPDHIRSESTETCTKHWE